MIQVCNNADATTFYVCEKFLNTLIIRLEHNTALVVKWFKNNYVKLNKDKCHLRVFPRTYHVFSTLTGHRSNRLQVVSTWLPRDVFVDFWT